MSCVSPALPENYGSTQFVVPPPMRVSAPLVAGNWGSHDTSVPFRFPVMFAPVPKKLKERSRIQTRLSVFAVTVAEPL